MKKWKKSLLVLIVCIVVMAVAIIMGMPPKSYESVHQREQSGIALHGVFKPGGYIDFEADLGEESLKGYYKGSVVIFLFNDTKTTIIDDAIFSERIYVGKDWPGSMSGSDKSMKPFLVKSHVELPETLEITTEITKALIQYNLSYPAYSGVATGVNRYTFVDKTLNIEKLIEIKIDKESLTEKDKIYLKRMDGLYGLILQAIMMACIFVGTVALIRFIMHGISKT